MIMPSALELVTKDEPLTKTGLVGLRSLPQLKLNYYARTPKPSPFATVWLPVNASNRIVLDEVQDIMYLHYSRHLQSKNGKRDNCRKSLDLDASFFMENRKESSDEFVLPPKKRPVTTDNIKAAMWMTNKNSLAPFASLGKPTCGYYFSRATDNKKRLTGIPPTNLVKFRSQEVHSHLVRN